MDGRWKGKYANDLLREKISLGRLKLQINIMAINSKQNRGNMELLPEYRSN